MSNIPVVKFFVFLDLRENFSFVDKHDGVGMGERLKLFFKLSPLLAPVIALFAGGFVLAAMQSLGFFLPVPVEGGLFDGYARLFQDSWFYESFLFTAYVALVSAGLAVALGTVIAYLIWKLPVRLQGPAIVYKTPLVLPHIAVAFIVLVFWTQSGLTASIGHALGLVDQPADFPALLFAGNGLGLIMAYAYKGSAFVILLVLAILKRLDHRLLVTAGMLGASRITVFFRIVLPHLKPVLHTSFIILFLYAFGAFDIPYLLSESDPGMLSIQTFNLYFKRDLANRPAAMAILVVMFLFSSLFIVLYTRITSRIRNGARKL